MNFLQDETVKIVLFDRCYRELVLQIGYDLKESLWNELREYDVYTTFREPSSARRIWVGKDQDDLI